MGKSEKRRPTKAVLTPTRARAVSWNDPKSGDGQQAKAAGQLQEIQVNCQENPSNEDQLNLGSKSADPPESEKPTRRTRSARAMHSLRKSLAWDKAFSTEEGILDGDELSLVAKTPKKLPDLPPLDFPNILALVSPAAKPSPITVVEAPKSVPGELSAAVKPSSDNSGYPLRTTSPGKVDGIGSTQEAAKTELLPTSGNGNAPILNGASHINPQSSSSAITSPTHIQALSAIPRPTSVLQVIGEAVEKGTKLRLPSSVVHTNNKLEKASEGAVKHEVNPKSHKDVEIVAKHRKDSEQTPHVKPLKDVQALTRCRSTSSLIKPPSTSVSISKKVSSVSKKVKDTIGRVLPGSMGGRSSANRKATAEAAHTDRLRLPASSTGLKVPGSPGPSHLTRSKSARAAVNGVTAYANLQKTGVLSELSNKGSSSNASVTLPSEQKKSKGESIWGSIRGRGGFSSTKGRENVPLSTCIPSPPALKKAGGIPSPMALKKHGGTEYANEIFNLHDLEESHLEARRDVPSHISKPSGLRLPSPKIGFFDAGRSTGSHEKPTVAVTDVMAKHGLPPRPPLQHGSTSARFAQPSGVDPLIAAVRGYLSSSIPVAPHVTRTSSKGRRKGLIPSASAPASPRKNSEMLSPGTHQAVTGRYLTSRSNFTRVHIESSPETRKETPGAARKLTLEHSDEKSERIASEPQEAAINDSSFTTTGCREEVPNTEVTPVHFSSGQSDEAILDSPIVITMAESAEVPLKHPVQEKNAECNVEESSGATIRLQRSPTLDKEETLVFICSAMVTMVTDTAEVPPKQPTEEQISEGDCEVSSAAITRLQQSPSSDNRVEPAASGDMTDHVLAEEISKFPSTKSSEKENLQSKLENLFESHWSGWPVLEVGTPASSSCPKESLGVSGSPESRRDSDGAEKSRDDDCGSLERTPYPLSDADACKNSRNPLAVNRALLNTATDGSRLSITPPLKKERGLLALARSAVSRLTSAASGGSSPTNENSRAIDRDGPGSGSFRKSRRHKSNIASKPFDLLEGNGDAESVSPYLEEAAVEEAILMKRGGAVQHSPPNKTQPPPNPWSPVKKGQHPGPFDCTKKTAVNTSVL